MSTAKGHGVDRSRYAGLLPRGNAVTASGLPPASPTRRPRTQPVSFLRTAEVADILHVSPKTVSRWAAEGRLPFQRTLGGHRRYPEAKIRELAASLREEPIG